MDQHYEVKLWVDGLGKVAMRTELGWVNKFSLELDAVSAEDAVESVKHLLREGMEVVSYCNDSGMEEHVESAKDSVSLVLSELDITGMLVVTDSIRIDVNIKKSYTIS